MSTISLAMSETQFDRLRKLIYERSGIYFQDSKKYVLESRLARRVEELSFENYDQYLMFLNVGPYKDDEFQEMFNRITVNETSFFRNEPQLDVFEKKVLPKLLEARRVKKTLRIWSSACSTGEEPYTLAMQVHRSLGVRLMDWKVEILGTDISDKVLAVAQSGVYTNYSIRSTPPTVVNRYFKRDGESYIIDPTIQSMVRFERVNLKEAMAVRRFGLWDVIFCRNVLIYFDDAMKKHCAKLFHEQLVKDGALFIGHSESLRNLSGDFVPMDDPQSFAYTKALAKGAGDVG